MRVRGLAVRSFVGASAVAMSLVGAGLLGGCNKAAVDAQKLAKQAQSIQGEDPKGASEMYKQAAQMDPTNHKILGNLAVLYERQKDWNNAAETYAKAAAIDDTFANYHFRRGYALMELALKDPGKAGLDKAKDPLKKAVAKDANIAAALFYLGKVHYELDEEQEALEVLTKAIETRSDQLHYYVELANIYLNLGMAEQGQAVALEGQKIAPQIKFENENDKIDGVNAWYFLALLEAKSAELLNKPDDKIKALEKTRTIPNPKNGARDSEYQLALAYADKGQPQDACQALASYLKTPAGKTPEQQESRKDAEGKKFTWKCP